MEQGCHCGGRLEGLDRINRRNVSAPSPIQVRVRARGCGRACIFTCTRILVCAHFRIRAYTRVCAHALGLGSFVRLYRFTRLAALTDVKIRFLCGTSSADVRRRLRKEPRYRKHSLGGDFDDVPGKQTAPAGSPVLAGGTITCSVCARPCRNR